MKIILNIIIFLISIFGYACSCKDWREISVLERINKTHQIFEGTVKNINKIDDKTLSIDFLITRKNKGVDSFEEVLKEADDFSRRVLLYHLNLFV